MDNHTYIHTNQYNKYYEKVRSIITKISSTDLTALQNVIINASKFKPRILVCAPSNTAVDNIILKIMEEGFLDGTGRRKFRRVYYEIFLYFMLKPCITIFSV